MAPPARTATMTTTSVLRGAAAAWIVSPSRNTGDWARGPAGDDRRDRDGSAVTRRFVALAPDEEERSDAGEQREHERGESGAGDQAVEERVGIGSEDRQAGEREC